MADANDPNVKPPGEDDAGDFLNQPYAQESDVDDDQPRRAASARFVVDSQIGSEAAMRDAMDPANQSLADALRLSFRVLQAVILVLIVLFLASGFQTVDEGYSGVRTVWGKIVADDGVEALSSGPKFSIFPYPIGEFVIFRDERLIDLGTTFTPHARGATTFEQMLEGADVGQPLVPGRDGSLITRDGDLAHLELSARYRIDQAGSFVRRVNDSDRSRDADRLVRLSIQKSAISVVAETSLQELMDQPDDARMRIQEMAQQMLNELGCGIALTQVQISNAYAPLAIMKTLGELQEARISAAESIDQASQRANETASKVAGQDFGDLVALIEQYEDALEQGDKEASTATLAAVTAKLDENRDGEVAQIIQNARSYKAQVESTLGNEYLRFASLLPAYRENPKLLVRQLWQDTYAKLIGRPDAEVLYVPSPLGSMGIGITGSAQIQDIRNKARLRRREQGAESAGYDPNRPYIMRASDMKHRKMLDVKDGRPTAINAP